MVQSVTKVRGERVRALLPPPFKFFLLLILGLTLVLAYKHFQDGYEKIDGKWRQKPEFRDKVDDKRDSYDECEVYYLIAMSNDLYECYNCIGKEFYLYKGEIVKIGMTCSGQDRYSQSFYQDQQVRYRAFFYGNLLECQQEEIRRLGHYAEMPENLQRPDLSPASIKKRRYKLLYPVRNTTLK